MDVYVQCVICFMAVYLGYVLYQYGVTWCEPVTDDEKHKPRSKRHRKKAAPSVRIDGEEKKARSGVFQYGQPPARKKTMTQVVAMDCEMVGVRDGSDSILARVSIVNSHGHCLYDTFVRPTEKVVDYRTSVSGVRPADMENGVDFHIAQKNVTDLLKDRILVGHGLKSDFDVLFMRHPKDKIRDTSQYAPFRAVVNGNTPSLKRLAKEILGVTVQQGEHSSVEDARAAMQLYNLYKEEWEMRWLNKKKI